MNKKLHFKSLILLCALIVGSVSAWADEVTFNFPSIASSNNWESGEAYTSVEITPITITAKGGGNNGKYYSSNGGSWRMYSGGTVEITASDGYTITGVSSNPEKSFTITNGVATFSPSAKTEFVSITVTYTTSGGGTPIPTTYTVTYNANEGTGTITDSNSPYEAGTTVTVLDNTFTRDGYTFTNWNTAADGSGTDYDEGATFTISANTTLYAQWEEQNDGNIQWVLTNLANLTSEDVFVIVGNNNGNNYAITNDKGTGSAPATVGVTIEGSTITSDVTANIQWTVSGDATNGYTFYPKGSTTTWLYCNTTAATSSNNNMRVGTGERKVFALNSNNYLLTKDDETTRYLSIYNDNDWRGYTNTNLCPTISFYKKVTDGVVPPSISADNVSLEYDATTGSISYTINNAVVGGSLTASTEASWLTLGTVSGSTITFTCSANETKTERTATATLTYTYNTDQTVTKTVTITQAGNPNVIDKISDIKALSTAYSVKGTVVAMNSKGFVIGDGTGYAYTYLNEAPTVKIGDKVSVSGTTATYGHILQFTSTAKIEASQTSNYNNTPAVKVIDAAAIAEYNKDYQLSDYVQFEGTLTKSDNYYNVTVGTASATTGGTASARISYPTEAQITTLNGLLNKKVRVKGYFAGFSSSTFTAMLESVEEIIVPTIAVTPTSPTGFIYEENDGPSEAQTFTVSGANLTGDITVSLDASSNFEISSDDATYGSSLTLSSSATNKLYVRLKAGLAISDDYIGTITLTSAGADNVEMNLSGSVVEKPSLSFDFTDTAWGFPADYEKAEKTYTNGGYTFTVGAVTEGGHKALISNSKQVALIFGKESGASITFPAFNFKVKKIKVYGNGTASENVTFNIFVEDDAVSTEVTSSRVTQTFEIAEANQSAGTIYTLKVTNAVNCQISKIDIIGDAVSVTIPESKYTTFASSDAVDFKDTGVTICVVKVDNNVAKLTPIRGTIVPANTGVILTAENAGSYAGVITTEEGSLDGNEMVGITTETVVAYNVGDKYNYILQGDKFKKATGDKLKAGKAYLSTTYNVAATGARELKIVFDGETTGIKAIETANNKSVYDLQGRKVAAPTKGLYIINGKKMIVK